MRTPPSVRATLTADDLRRALGVSESRFERLIREKGFPQPVWDHWTVEDVRRWFRYRQQQQEREFKRRLNRITARKARQFEF